MRKTTAAVMLACLLLGGAESTFAQDSRAASWSEEKCVRYTRAWTELMSRRGKEGLGSEFLERHDAFLASGCTTRADVCPRSKEELDVANIMIIQAMNAGTASTFPPFACRR